VRFESLITYDHYFYPVPSHPLRLWLPHPLVASYPILPADLHHEQPGRIIQYERAG
jgi:hypothetical protein